MEFLRFGSSLPGAYWGCCAFDIIQDFKQKPDDPACIQIVSGDGGEPLTRGGKELFAGPTYRDIFEQRIRFGTFDTRDMPNHGFLAVLTDKQIRGSVGSAWLKILKENGFEFIRTVSNSVYAGQILGEPEQDKEQALNHLFGLFRNIGRGAAYDPFTPPQAWQDLTSVCPEAWTKINEPEELAKAQWQAQTAVWKAKKPKRLLTREQLEELGVPITLSGRRSKYPQELETDRKNRQEYEVSKAAPWQAAKIAMPDEEEEEDDLIPTEIEDEEDYLDYEED